MTVWVVVYSNYDPVETDSVWSTEVEAEKRCEELNAKSDTGMWLVVPWTVSEVWEPA